MKTYAKALIQFYLRLGGGFITCNYCEWSRLASDYMSNAPIAYPTHR